MKLNAKYILENYPKIKVKGRKGKLIEMNNDLFFVNMSGKIERVINGQITECKKNRKKWVEFEIKDSVLIDSGIKDEEIKL